MISINKQNCSKCDICIESCPMSLLVAHADSGYPQMPDSNAERCTFCGHCEASCPNDALIHSYPENLTPALESGKWNISPEQIGLYMRSRRSVRNYQNKPVEKEKLLKIMDIVRYSPTGLNRQAVKWIAILSPEKVKEVTELTVAWMRGVLQSDSPMKGIINFEGLVKGYENGKDFISRKAPHLVVAYAHKEDSISAIDATIALAHLELALPAYGLGGCWAGYIGIALRYFPVLRQAIGIPENNEPLGVLMLGYPKYKYSKIPQRKKQDISWL